MASGQLEYFLFLSNNPFTCLPNYLYSQMSATTLTYPLCAPDNFYGCRENLVGFHHINQAYHEAFIYPNPSSGPVTIEPHNVNNAGVDVYDFTGRLVFSTQITGKTELNLDLIDGVYFFKISSGTFTTSKKILVTK